jgi:hypothetical protein
MFKDRAAAERQYWLQVKAREKNFLVRQEMLGSLLLWLVITAVDALTSHPHSFSLRSILFPSLIMLPIFLLYGYLNAGWRWKDSKKKHPE